MAGNSLQYPSSNNFSIDATNNTSALLSQVPEKLGTIRNPRMKHHVLAQATSGLQQGGTMVMDSSYTQGGHGRLHSLNSTNSGDSHVPYSQINNVNHFNFSIINNSPGNNTNPVFNATTNLTDSLHSIIKANAPYLGTPKGAPTKVRKV